MKARVEKPNPWLLLNRARKVARVVLLIEEQAGKDGVKLEHLPGAVARWDDETKRRVSVAAGQRPLSDEAWLDVLAMLRERTRAA